MTTTTKIQGPPGSGKTRTTLDIAEKEYSDYEVDAEDLIYLSYTVSASEEGRNRVAKRLDMEPDKLRKKWRTIHSQCFDLLELSRKQTITSQERKIYCNKLNINYSKEWDDIDPSENMTKEEGNRLFSAYYYHRARKIPIDKISYNKFNLPPKIEGFTPQEFCRLWDGYKKEKNLIDFCDMLSGVMRYELVPDADVMIVDEFQDMTPLQYDVYSLWRDNMDRVYISGDPKQCVPEGSLVETKNGKKPIEEIEKGDEVKSAYGKGETYLADVESVHKRKTEENIIKLKTKNGYQARFTSDHHLFSRPTTEREESRKNDWYFVYLMLSSEGDIRIGITKDMKRRLRIEAGGYAIKAINSFENKNDALIEENYISYKYGIPQISFKSRNGMTQNGINKIFNEINTFSNYKELCKNKNFDNDSWHFISQGKSIKGRGEPQKWGSRSSPTVTLNLKMCCRRRERKTMKDYISHKIIINTSNQKVINFLENNFNLTVSKTKKGGKTFRKQNSDYTKLRKTGEKIASKLREKGFMSHLKETVSFDKDEGGKLPLTILPASEICEGMIIPIYEDGEIKYDEVIEKEEQINKENVYDLTVEPTHNYIVNNIAVHNSIYVWGGASPRFLLNEDVDNMKRLRRTYRLPSKIWEMAKEIAETFEWTKNLNLKTKDIDGKIIYNKKEEMEDLTRLERFEIMENFIIDYLENDKDIMLLLRTKAQVQDIEDYMRLHGIPFEALRGYPLWTNKLNRLRETIRKCFNGKKLETKSRRFLRRILGESGFDKIRRNRDKKSIKTVLERQMNIGNEFFNRFQLEALKNNVLFNDFMFNPKNLRIGTKHSSKGKENNIVITSFDTAPPIAREMYEDSKIKEDEKRVDFVTLTRAEQEVVMSDSLFPDEPNHTLAKLKVE